VSENTEVRSKSAGKKWIAIVSATISPILIYFAQDIYATVKNVNVEVAQLRTEVAEVRNRDVDNMWAVLNIMRKDMEELKINVAVLDRLYGMEYTLDQSSEVPAIEDLQEDVYEDIHKAINELREQRDELDEYKQMQQQLPPMGK
jgi:hypothetical protein